VQALRFTSNCMLSQFSCTSSIVVLQSMPCPAATIFKEDNTLSTIFIFFVNRFFAFVFSSILYVHAVKHFHFLVVFFGFVFPVHCVLVSSYAVLCLFPVCVYSYIQMVSFTKKMPHHFSKTIWVRNEATIANEQNACHETTWKSQWKSKWKSILALKKW
jgi:hypothetical protein